MRRQRRELQRQLPAECQRALRADQQVREVGDAVIGVGARILTIENVDVVAGDAPQHLRHARDNLVAFAQRDALYALYNLLQAHPLRRLAQRPEARLAAVGEDRFDRLDVVHHVAVLDRARAARIVAGHPADRALRGRRDIHRKPQPMRLEPGVQMIQHNARFDRHGARFGIERDDIVQPLTGVDHQRLANRLPALARAGAAREQRHLLAASDFERDAQIVLITRHYDANRRDLVDRRIRGVTAAARRIEQHIAAQRFTQALRERRRHSRTGRHQVNGFDEQGGSGIRHNRRPEKISRRASH